MLPFILPALIGGIGSLAASAIKSSSDQKMAREQNLLNAQQAEKQWEYSEEQQERQFQYDLQTMEKQRVYDLEDRQFAIDNPTVIKGEVDYEQMVASAEKAGINPLTALRNGGSAGFSATSQPSAPLSRTAPTRHAALRHAPGQTAAPGMGGAIGDGIMGFLQNFDPFADQKREMEQRLVEAQISSLNAGTLNMRSSANRPMSFNVPAYTANTMEQRTSGKSATVTPPSRVMYDMDGTKIPVGPGSKAGDWEDEYGEVAGELEGFPRYLRDRVKPALMNPKTYGLNAWPSWEYPQLKAPPPYLDSIRPPLPKGGGGGW